MKNPFFKLLFILFCFYSFSLKAQFPPADSSYELVFYDEFDTIFPGTIINDSLWDRTPPWNQGTNITGNVNCCVNPGSGCDTSGYIYWDVAYKIRNPSDSSTIKISNGTCKLLTNKVDTVGEVWNWPECDPVTDTAVTGTPCQYDTCLLAQDSTYYCYTIDTIPFKYTSGELYSRQMFKYGYFEIKFKLPPLPVPPNNFRGHGANFFLYAANPASGNWWSEIDIFELNAFNSTYGDTSDFTSSVHYSNKDSSWHPFAHVDPGNITNNVWHIAACWWTPEFIKIYLDDTLILSVQNDTLIPTDSLIKMPIFIDTSNPASNFCTNFDTVNTQFPYTYEIDYVRVYQLKQQCDTDKVYCNVTESTFESRLYNSLTIGGDSCVATFTSGANVTGLGNEYVLLDEGFYFDNTSQGYFDVKDCFTGQFSERVSQPLIPLPPPISWLRKFHYK
ncbi:MAG TPA: family 16 glycosylhydrolase [Bacteroidia bacterium]|nr:family 16 glycosylhydrolase [Bacteroidia bacterium]